MDIFKFINKKQKEAEKLRLKKMKIGENLALRLDDLNDKKVYWNLESYWHDEKLHGRKAIIRGWKRVNTTEIEIKVDTYSRDGKKIIKPFCHRMKSFNNLSHFKFK